MSDFPWKKKVPRDGKVSLLLLFRVTSVSNNGSDSLPVATVH